LSGPATALVLIRSSPLYPDINRRCSQKSIKTTWWLLSTNSDHADIAWTFKSLNLVLKPHFFTFKGGGVQKKKFFSPSISAVLNSFLPFHRASKDLDGIETDDLEVDLVLRQHPPEVLPIFGKRFVIWYPGIPKQCKKCYNLDHIAKNCTNPAIEWLDYVAGVHQLGTFKDELFGTWLDTLKLHHPKYNPALSNPQDLRQEIQFNRQGLQQNDLRRQIGNNPEWDARTTIGFRGNRRARGRTYRGSHRGYNNPQTSRFQDNQEYYQPNESSQQPQDNQYHQPHRHRGRGRYQRRPYRGY